MITREPTLERLAIAQSLMLEPFGLDEASWRRLATIREHRVDDADLYFQTTRHEGWSLEEGIVKSGSFSIDQGVGVRAVAGEKTAFAYSDDLSSSRAAGRRAHRAHHRRGRPEQTHQAGAGKIAWPAAACCTRPPTRSPRWTARRRWRCWNGGELARAKDPRIVQVMASVAAEYDVVLVARADGTRAADVRPLVRLNVTVIAEQTGAARWAPAAAAGASAWATSRTPCDRELRRQAVNAALTNLESRPAPAGEMTVVLGPGWPGVLLHEAVGHGLEGDFNRKGSSTFAGRIGQRVAAKGVTVLDDGTIADRRGSLNVDDEGHATQRNVLIEDGILRGYIQDSLNARLMGVKPTGNGRRESYAHVPMPRMTNTYMLGGSTRPGRDRGQHQARPVRHQLRRRPGRHHQRQVRVLGQRGLLGRERQDPVPGEGRHAHRQRPRGADARQHDRQRPALDTGVGVCGKDGQSVPVGVGQPTLRIDRLTVGGTA
jgi:TldD protein